MRISKKKWNKFPEIMPPENVRVLVIDISAHPPQANIAEYSVQTGWSYVRRVPDNMFVSHWMPILDFPKEVKFLGNDDEV